MKKYLFLLILFLLVGCSGGEKVKCNIKGKEAIFTLKDGMINSYSLDGKKVSNKDIDQINGLNFTSSKDNEDGKRILNSYVSSLGGSCEK